jgi:hypothetical protein
MFLFLKIHHQNRFDDSPVGTKTFVSLDGTDFPIEEPESFDRKWYSHKFKGPGLRYEIGLNIYNANIVWAMGGFPCGLWPDLKLARECYLKAVLPGELTIADDGYADKKYFIYPRANPEISGFLKAISNRHETVNHRIRHFAVLAHRYRHSLVNHSQCFNAVINLTQLMLENGEPLYQIQMS